MVSSSDSIRSERGFTAAELLVVTTLVAICAAITVPVTMTMVERAESDSTLTEVKLFMASARERAISERRNIELSFAVPGTLRLDRVEVPGGAKTRVGELQLNGGHELLRNLELGDTPDGFGNLSFFQFTGTAPFMFTSDGSFIDSAGDVSNGTIFFGVRDKRDSARAVTVFGVTGLIHSWRWGGAGWVE